MATPSSDEKLDEIKQQLTIISQILGGVKLSGESDETEAAVTTRVLTRTEFVL